MARLPVPGSDDGVWGSVLNDYLLQAHTSQGILKTGVVGTSQLQDNSVTSVKLASDSVTSSAVADESISESQLDTDVQAKLNTTAAVTSVNGQDGDVTLTKSDIGLGNVDNTSDVNKPISTATQTALDAKADADDVGSKVLLIQNAASLPVGTPADVVVVLKA